MTTLTLAKEGLERSVPFLLRDDDDAVGGDGLTLVGYAAVFNRETQIDSWEGTFLEKIAPGAFRKTIRERTPVLQFDHGRHPLIGSLPIGSIDTLREDDEGLYVEAQMADNWLMEPLMDAIRNRSVNGMSFRFEVIREKWEDKNGKEIKDPEELRKLLWGYGDVERLPLTRTLKELKVHELGPVVFPAYTQTSVDLRSQQIANLVLNDEELRREVRSALVLQRIPRPVGELTKIGDNDIRKDVARAILFGAPAVGGHSPEKVEPPTDKGTQDNEVIEDAPPTSGHPSRPARDDLRTRMQYALRTMNRRLDSVNEELLSG